MTTYRRYTPARPRGQWFGWGISLLAHAGVLAWLLHMPPPPPATTAVARMRFVLVAPRPRPAVPVAIVPARRAAASSPAPARATRSRVEKLAPAPASTSQTSSEATAPTAIITADTPAPAEKAAPGGTESTSAASTGSTTPGFDMGAARASARLITKHRKDGLVAFPKPEAPLERDDRLGRAIERARRGDCKSAYSGLGLLAVIPLAKDTLTGTGCKW